MPGYKRKAPATFRARKRSRVLPKSTRRRRTYGRYATRPSRFRTRSASEYKRTRKVASLVSLVAETKFAGYNSDKIVAPLGKESATPQGKPGGTQPLSYVFFNTGDTMVTAQTPGQWNNMKLFNYGQGDSSTERDGNYLFIKQASVKMNIQMLGGVNTGTAGAGVNQGLNAPVLFRVMVVKANRKNMPMGLTKVLNDTLFIDTENGKFGPAGTTASPYLYMNAPINTRDWLTYMDTKFVLSPAAVDFNDQSTASSINSANPKYPTFKNFNFKCSVQKKAHFPSSGSVQPDSIDPQWMVVIQAVSTGYTLSNSADWSTIGSPRNFRVQALGTTTALDV